MPRNFETILIEDYMSKLRCLRCDSVFFTDATTEENLVFDRTARVLRTVCPYCGCQEDDSNL